MWNQGFSRATALACSALLAPTATADVHHVPGEYGTIQEAIDAADDGDKVKIASGTYSGPGNIDLTFGGKVITVHGRWGRNPTIIDCGGLGRALTFAAGEDCTIRGITVKNGLAPATGGPAPFQTVGGAVVIDSASPAFERCRFIDNRAESVGPAGGFTFSGIGGAVFCNGGSPSFSRCTFEGNLALTLFDDLVTAFGGAMHLTGGGSITVSECTFDSNATDSGGGLFRGIGGAMFVSSGTNIAIDASVFTGNSTSLAGGAIWMQENDSTLTDCEFLGNSGQSGAAVVVFGNGAGATSHIEGCRFEGNVQEADAGMGTADQQNALSGTLNIGAVADALVLDCDFIGNTAVTGNAGALSVVDGGVVTVDGCEFRDNTAALDGGAINNSDPPDDGFDNGPSTLTMIDCDLDGNTAQRGGGVASTFGSTLTATGCRFEDNSAVSTGILTGIGGAMIVGETPGTTVADCIFEGNRAMSPGVIADGFGGAVATELFASPIILTVTGSSFTGNNASIAGGALWFFGAPGGVNDYTVEDSHFEGNSGQSSGAIAFQNFMDLAIRRCEFIGNYAREDITFLIPGVQEDIGGGAVSGGTNASLLLEDSLFVENESRAGRGGAVSLFDDSTASIRRCEFRENTAAREGGAVVNHEAASVAPFSGDDGTVWSTMELVNCLLACNGSEVGGGGVANLEGSELTMINCTVADNTAPAGGGLLNAGEFQAVDMDGLPVGVPKPSDAALTNDVLWGNDADQITEVDGPQTSVVTTVTFSLVQGGWPGLANIMGDPMFVGDDDDDDDDDGGGGPPCGNFNYRLAAGSPAIDAGDNAAVPAGVTTDLAGHARIVNGTVDMGAYEVQDDDDDDDDDGEAHGETMIEG